MTPPPHSPPPPAAPAPRTLPSPATLPGHTAPSHATFSSHGTLRRCTNLTRAWYLRRPTSPGGDQGSVAVFTVVFAVAVIFLLALIVDGGNAMNARERAADIAGQAARAAADDISPATLRSAPLSGNALPIDWGSACGYAQQVVQKYGPGWPGPR